MKKVKLFRVKASRKVKTIALLFFVGFISAIFAFNDFKFAVFILFVFPMFIAQYFMNFISLSKEGVRISRVCFLPWNDVEVIKRISKTEVLLKKNDSKLSIALSLDVCDKDEFLQRLKMYLKTDSELYRELF